MGEGGVRSLVMRHHRTYGYESRTHPLAPLFPQPHGYLRGREGAYRYRQHADDVEPRPVIGFSSSRLSPAEYQRRRTYRG